MKFIGKEIVMNKKKKNQNSNITPLVNSLSGVFTLNENFDVKNSYVEYLIRKYK